MSLSANLIENYKDYQETPELETPKNVSPYVPVEGIIDRVARLTEKERLFAVAPKDRALLNYAPGQFYMVGIPGYGEAPISISSGPGETKEFELCIRAVGNLTNAIHRLTKGDRLWVRGPFGRGFNVDEFKGKDIVYVAGGIGIVPMRSLIKATVGNPGFGRQMLVYGSKGPDEILFHGEMEEWRELGMDVRLTVDKPHPNWNGSVGVVTSIIPKLDIDPKKTIAVVIGPPVMYKFVILSLREKKIKDEDMLLSLERRMKCGLGKCGHCQINSVYVCQCGPVFRLSELAGLPEAI